MKDKKRDKKGIKRVEDIGSLWDLDDIDGHILKHLIKYPGTTNAELGEIVGLSSSTIQRRREKPGFVRAYGELTATTSSHLKEAARRAAIRLKKMVDADDEGIAIQAMKMALAQYINKTSVDVSVQPRTVYRTSVQVDGTLLQEIVEAEMAHAFLGAPRAQDDGE